jgi:hypothetical protein
MPQERLPTRKVRDLLRLKAGGLSKRKIAASIGMSATAAGDCIPRVREADIDWPLPEDMNGPSWGWERRRVYAAGLNLGRPGVRPSRATVLGLKQSQGRTSRHSSTMPPSRRLSTISRRREIPQHAGVSYRAFDDAAVAMTTTRWRSLTRRRITDPSSGNVRLSRNSPHRESSRSQHLHRRARPQLVCAYQGQCTLAFGGSRR